MNSELDREEWQARWRLVLGSGCEEVMGGISSEEWQQREALLSYLYDREYHAGRNVRKAGGKSRDGSGTLDPSQLTVPEWINGIHQLFPQRVIERIEKDALERYEIQEMVTNAELLRRAQPNQTLLKAILHTKHLMNQEVLALAREMVRRVVNDLMEKLAREVRTPFTGSPHRRRSFLKIAKNFDIDTTIRRNLKNYDPESGKIYIKETFFHSRIRRQVDRWQIIIVVDQSGSMVNSVIHAAVTAAIFFGIRSLRPHLVVFDTSVVDLTEQCTDPVETLMKVQLGGGTDIGQALTYASMLVDNPRRTIVVLITDFFEGAPTQILLQTTKSLVESGVTLLGLAALDSEATPTYDRDMAEKMVRLGAHVAAMTPGELAEWVAERVNRS